MKKFFKIAGFVLLGLVVVGTFVFLWNKSKQKPTEYEILQAETRTIKKKITINGSISPRNEVALKPQISGIITELYKEAGQLVKVGDVIAKVKVVPDLATLNNAESRVKLAQISFEQAKNEYERANTLHSKGVLSKEEYENAHTAFMKAKEEVSNAKEALEIIKEGISSSTASYSNTLIKSTMTGMILDIPVKVGSSVIQANNFNEGTTIATIANMNDLIFVGKIDETEVGKVAVGNTVNLIIGAMQDSECSAILEYISPKGSLENGATTFEIKAAVTNTSDGFIRSGYSANGEVIIAQKDSILTIPESALEFAGDSAFVYRYLPKENENDPYVKTFVNLGLSDGVYIEVIKGLRPKDKVRGKIITNDKPQAKRR